MGCLEGARCYLSGPIEHNNTDWRKEPKAILEQYFRVNLFDPFADPKQQGVPAIEAARVKGDYTSLASIARKFVRKDLCMVDRSDFVVAYLPCGVPTTGTHHEILLSNMAKKPTLLVCPEGRAKLPVWYWGFIHPEAMLGSWEELKVYLQKVDDGQCESNDRWHFVYKMI